MLRRDHEQEADASQAAARSRPSCADARHHPIPEQGRWLGQRRARALQLLRSARQQRRDQHVPRPGDPTLVAGAPTPQPAAPPELGTRCTASSIDGYRQPTSRTPGPTSASTPEPKGGAQCGSPARWDLRGGPPAMAVPTAIVARLMPGVARLPKRRFPARDGVRDADGPARPHRHGRGERRGGDRIAPKLRTVSATSERF